MNNDNFMPMFEIELNAGVKGQKGDKGDKGDQGIQGIQGIQGEQGIPGIQGVKGDTGATGNGIAKIEQTTESHVSEGVNVWTITETNGTTDDFNVRNGEKGDKGDKGDKGNTGATGNGIASVEKTSTVGDVDTYTITFTDGNDTTFDVTNGASIATIEKTSTAGLVDTYTITLTNGDTETFTVTNGVDGSVTDVLVDDVSVVDNGKAYISTEWIYNVLPKVSASDVESATLDNTSEKAPLKTTLKGNTSQNNSILPDIYKQVEYIESSGTQYINTNYNPDISTDYIETNASYSGTDEVGCLFGIVTSSSQFWQLNKTTTANQFRLIALTGDVFYTYNDYANKHKYKTSGKELYIDNNLIATGTGTFTSSIPLFLFSRNSNGTANQFGKWKIYSCRIYSNTTLVRDFIPCYRISDNEIGLYDLVNNQFYTNSGTGTFTKGSNSVLPNPDYPQPINVVSGDNEVVVCGKNLVFENLNEYLSASGTGDNRTIISVEDKRAEIVKVKPNTTYYCSGDFTNMGDNVCRTLFFNHKPTINSISTKFLALDSGDTFTTSADTEYIMVYSTLTRNVVVPNFFICEQALGTTYEPYQSQTYPINLPVGMELCKIGDYQDYFYKDSGKWYLHKEIGKYTFTGNETFTKSYAGHSNAPHIFKTTISEMISAINDQEIKPMYCSHYPNGFSYDNLVMANVGTNGICIAQNHTITISSADYTYDNDLATFKTWLSTHNTTVYYPLATPTNTEITDNTLIEQLEAIKSATSYKTQTNVMQENNDKPFIIDMETIQSLAHVLDGE